MNLVIAKYRNHGQRSKTMLFFLCQLIDLLPTEKPLSHNHILLYPSPVSSIYLEQELQPFGLYEKSEELAETDV
jgi:hypothetical protein